jgi:hypothetical protein
VLWAGIFEQVVGQMHKKVLKTMVMPLFYQKQPTFSVSSNIFFVSSSFVFTSSKFHKSMCKKCKHSSYSRVVIGGCFFLDEGVRVRLLYKMLNEFAGLR